MKCVIAILEDAQRSAGHATNLQLPDSTRHIADAFDVMEMDAPADSQNDPWLLSLGLRLPSAFS
eukprot:11115426-Karenia_brevis.AAC.1